MRSLGGDVMMIEVFSDQVGNLVCRKVGVVGNALCVLVCEDYFVN